MSYTINLTNGNVFAVVPSGTINQSSSMTLIGQNYAGYGQFLDDNFIRLLESGANSTPPGAPLTGQLWFNTVAGVLEVYTGAAFKAVGGSQASSSAPTSNAIGDLWYDTVNQQLKVWTGTQWLLVGPIYNATTGVTGAIPGTIIDNTSTSHTVIELFVGNVIVGFISSSATFTPQSAISGFTTIRPGITLSTLVGNSVPLFQGTATNSQQFNGLTSTQFMRADTNTSTTGVLSIQNNGGLIVGAGNNFGATVSGNTVNLTNNTYNGNININANISGVPATVVAINGANGTMSLVGNILTAGAISATGTVSGSSLLGTTVSASGNIAGGNIVTAGIVSASGNVTGSYILGNGAFLTGISSSGNINYSNSNVAGFMAAFGANSISTSGNITAGNASASGNITGNYILGNGAFLTGISGSGNVNYSNSNVAGFMAAFGANSISTSGTVTSGNITGSNILTSGLVSATGNITGSYILGNGAFLTGISGGGNVNYSNSNVSSFLAAFGSNTISTTGSITSNGLVDPGDLNFTSTGSGQRILGRFTGSPHSARVRVQDTYSPNLGNPTSFGVLPASGGTGGSNFTAYTLPDADNSPTIAFAASNAGNANHSIISTGTVGGAGSSTFSGLPIAFYVTPQGEIARMLNNGHVLIGTTTDNGNTLQVSGNTSISSDVTIGGNTTISGANTVFNGTGQRIYGAFGNPYTSRNDLLTFKPIGNQQMRFNIQGGTTGVNAGNANFLAYAAQDMDNAPYMAVGISPNSQTGGITTGANGSGGLYPLTLVTNTTSERMRIDVGGNIMMGTTTVSGSNLLTVNGSIGATAFNNTSDYRLKDNIQPITNALDKVSQLKPVSFTWKKTGLNSDGFIAHELQQVLPLAVTGVKDQINAVGNPVHQQVDKSSLVATLTAAIQELNTKFNEKIAELEAKLKAAGIN